MRRVPALRPGDTVGLVSPSSPSSRRSVDTAVQAVRELGFQVKVGPSCYAALGYMAGEDSLRARDVNEMFADPGVRGILCLRGGDGATRLPPLIDLEAIARTPKVFLGYSDITILHQMFNCYGGFCTFHGPMPATEFSKPTFPGYVRDHLLQALCREEPLGRIEPYEGAAPMETLVPGAAEGELVGGNLALVCALLGTPWEIDTRGRILVLEDVDEPPYRIDRMLTQLRLAGKLQDAAGIVLGQFNHIKPKNPSRTLSLAEIFEAVVAPVGTPCLTGGCFGHGEKKVTLPLGARAALDGAAAELTLLESGVLGDVDGSS
ncbi:MAG: LD-carboxypeptidase [Synergistales bacterium]|nr:LD-carboxypeptidase [Synergistales bacterium]